MLHEKQLNTKLFLVIRLTGNTFQAHLQGLTHLLMRCASFYFSFLFAHVCVCLFSF